MRPWRTTDADDLVRAAALSPDLATQTGGADLSRVDAAAAFIERALPFGEAARNWAIVRDGRVVGNVAMSAIEHRHDTAWASYWVSADARGRGLATRALVAASAWALGGAGLFRLELGHRVNNPASCMVATRAGFVAEGLERRKLRYGDERFDVETHARLASDPTPEVEPLPVE